MPLLLIGYFPGLNPEFHQLDFGDDGSRKVFKSWDGNFSVRSFARVVKKTFVLTRTKKWLTS
jgi:hypothetical protein